MLMLLSTQALLEEAFVSTEDDIFDSQSIRLSADDLHVSPSALRAISRSTSTLRSPCEVPVDEVDLEEDVPGRHRSVPARSLAWQANYVSRMKKHAKAGRHAAASKNSARVHTGKKKARKEQSLVQSGDAIVELDGERQVVDIKAKLSGSGRVNMTYRGEISGDAANLDDYLYDESDGESETSDEYRS